MATLKKKLAFIKKIRLKNVAMLTLAGMVNSIVNRFQVTKMKEIIHDIDPTAYITISEVADVYSANLK